MTPPADALDALVDALATRVAAKVAELLPRAASPHYADAKHNPLCSSWAFLAAGRRGEFPTFKRGRNTVALWADVEAYVERRRCAPRARVAEGDDRSELQAAGVRLRHR